MTKTWEVPSVLGPVSVRQSPEVDRYLRREGAMGNFNWQERIIRLSTQMPEEMVYKTLGHEIGHLWLYDSGLQNLLTPKMEEAICDAFGVWFGMAVKSGKLSLNMK